MGALSQGFQTGMDLGNNTGSFWRRRKLEREMESDRVRRRTIEDTELTRRRELDAEMKGDRARQRQLQDELETQRRAEMGAAEMGTLAEIDSELMQMRGAGAQTPEQAARAAALRRKRVAVDLQEGERERMRAEREQGRIERQSEDSAAEYGTTAEIEAALQAMNAKPEGDWTPEDATQAAALRRRRAGMAQPEQDRMRSLQEFMRAQQERDQGGIERRAEMGAAETGTLAEIEAALQAMSQKPDGDMSPEDAAMEAALRRRRAGAMQQQAGSGMAKVKEIDPQTGGEVEYQKPLAQIMAERAAAAGGGQQQVTTRPATQQAQQRELAAGTIVQQNGRRYQFRGGNPNDPANYQEMR
jgi:hypothetical protein